MALASRRMLVAMLVLLKPWENGIEAFCAWTRPVPTSALAAAAKLKTFIIGTAFIIGNAGGCNAKYY